MPESPRETTARANACLLATAVLWGFAFVAQREGMDHVGPFLFNAVRFSLGVLTLLPLMILYPPKGGAEGALVTSGGARRNALLAGLLVGEILFLGASFQQAGLVSTTASKAGFITGMYVVLVPIFGLAAGRRTGMWLWAGAALVFGGLYLLSVQGGFAMVRGDFLVLVGAACWACHVLTVGWLAPYFDPLRFAALQYAVCAALSFTVAAFEEELSWRALEAAAPAIIYGGVVSVGIAYTLQVVGQRRAHPSAAAIIMSLEALFAALGGWLVLQESLTVRQMAGCALMLAGTMVAQARWPVGNAMT